MVINTDGSEEGLEELGVFVEGIVGTVVAARVPVDSFGGLTSLVNVRSVQVARQLQTSNDVSVPATGATAFRNQTGLDGSGTIVAVIDTGVDFTHPDFRNPDGSTRILALCDQTDPPRAGDNTCPGGGSATGGTFWTKPQIDAALVGSGTVREVDTSGHGSHVLGSAAGNGPVFGGMAPGADLIVVKSDLFTNDIIGAMDFIEDQATLLGKPYAINMSFGGHVGPHDGTDAISQAINGLVGPGRVVAVAPATRAATSVTPMASLLRDPCW